MLSQTHLDFQLEFEAEFVLEEKRIHNTRYQLIATGRSHFDVRVMAVVAGVSKVRRYTRRQLAVAEFRRSYHEAYGWHHGLKPDFQPANDHEANGMTHRIESEAEITALLDEAGI